MKTLTIPLEQFESFVRDIVEAVLKEKGVASSKQCISLKDAAAILQVNVAFVRKLVNEEKLRGYKVSRRVVVLKSSVDHYLASVQIGTNILPHRV